MDNQSLESKEVEQLKNEIQRLKSENQSLKKDYSIILDEIEDICNKSNGSDSLIMIKQVISNARESKNVRKKTPIGIPTEKEEFLFCIFTFLLCIYPIIKFLKSLYYGGFIEEALIVSAFALIMYFVPKVITIIHENVHSLIAKMYGYKTKIIYDKNFLRQLKVKNNAFVSFEEGIFEKNAIRVIYLAPFIFFFIVSVIIILITSIYITNYFLQCLFYFLTLIIIIKMSGCIADIKGFYDITKNAKQIEYIYYENHSFYIEKLKSNCNIEGNDLLMTFNGQSDEIVEESFFDYKKIKKKYRQIADLQKLDKVSLDSIIKTVELELSFYSNSLSLFIATLSLIIAISAILIGDAKDSHLILYIFGPIIVYYLGSSVYSRSILDYLNKVRYVRAQKRN